MSYEKLHRAKKRKNDEFYTRFEDVEKELAHYPHTFEGKTVYCNCDDPFKSAFVKYFKLNFDRLKLKRLIATCFNGDAGKGETMFLFPRTDDRVAWHFEKTADGETCTPLQYNGDFRSEECVALLRQCDVVVTNPPFSLFKTFFRTLIENDVDFIMLGHPTAIALEGIFPCIKDGKVFVERLNTILEFDNENGGSTPIQICWLSTLKSDYKKPFLNLTATYSPNHYPRFDNYDAIIVDKTEDIPCDYNGVMGVPVTIFGRLNTEQFEAVGITKAFGGQTLIDKDFHLNRRFDPFRDGKHLYTRIFIKRKNFSCNCSNDQLKAPERKNTSKEKPTNQPKKNPEELDLNYDEP